MRNRTAGSVGIPVVHGREDVNESYLAPVLRAGSNTGRLASAGRWAGAAQAVMISSARTRLVRTRMPGGVACVHAHHGCPYADWFFSVEPADGSQAKPLTY